MIQCEGGSYLLQEGSDHLLLEGEGTYQTPLPLLDPTIEANELTVLRLLPLLLKSPLLFLFLLISLR
jgi:hypothetical protein